MSDIPFTWALKYPVAVFGYFSLLTPLICKWSKPNCSPIYRFIYQYSINNFVSKMLTLLKKPPVVNFWQKVFCLKCPFIKVRSVLN